MDLHEQWKYLCWKKPNAGEIMSFTTNVVKEYWKIIDEKPFQWDKRLGAYRTSCMRGDYMNVYSQSLEFIFQETGIQLDNSILLSNRHGTVSVTSLQEDQGS